MQRPPCSFAFVALLVCAATPIVIEGGDQQPKSRGASTAQPAKATAWKRIPGTPGVDARYGSGYIDLDRVTTFVQGEKLRLRIGGSAKHVVVRLLPAGSSPSEPVGIINTFSVPADRLIVLTLESQHPQVRQISIHGGPKPWDIYDLGGGNGPATLLSADREER
jgi:hypothetical protein